MEAQYFWIKSDGRIKTISEKEIWESRQREARTNYERSKLFVQVSGGYLWVWKAKRYFLYLNKAQTKALLTILKLMDKQEKKKKCQHEVLRKVISGELEVNGKKKEEQIEFQCVCCGKTFRVNCQKKR